MTNQNFLVNNDENILTKKVPSYSSAQHTKQSLHGHDYAR